MNKSNLVFLDTETTGRGPEDRLCQVAYKIKGEEFESLFKPPLPIEVEAMAISHITNRMVADKESFADSKMKKDLQEIFAGENILVAHNADFDAEMLKREGIEVSKTIDTLKLAHYLDKDGEVSRHSLQYLRYYFDLDVQDAQAHNALGDVRVLEKLFDLFFDKMMDEIISDEKSIIEKMLEVSALPILIKRFNFGKYSGEKVEEVAEKDFGYLRWLYDQKIAAKIQGLENDANWIYTLEKYLKQ